MCLVYVRGRFRSILPPPGMCHTRGVTTSSTAGARRRNPRGEGWRLREDLLKAAGDLLDEGVSPDVMSLREIARRAQVSPMAPYRHFDDVHALLDEVMRQRFAEFRDQLVSDQGTDPEAGPAERLRALCERYVAYGRANPTTYHVLFDSSFLAAGDQRELPGVDLFERVETLVAACAKTPNTRAATRVLWCGLHGVVSLPGRGTFVGWADDAELIGDLLDAVIGQTEI